MSTSDKDLSALLNRALDANVRVCNRTVVGGGCIADSQKLVLEDGRHLLVKTMPVNSAVSVLSCERDSLNEISQAGALRSPVCLGFAIGASVEMLVLEYVEPCEPTAQFWRKFGQQLAEMHRWCGGAQTTTAVSPRYGFREDNFIGRTSQKNAFADDWVDFFGSNRLGFQIGKLESSPLSSTTAEIVRDTRRLIEQLDRYLPRQPAVSLLHGDLWSGNFLATRADSPSSTQGDLSAVVFDPAVYYGDREAEFAMTLLFGGFPAAFYDAYNAAWQMESGWQERVEIYKLYHLLNHVNLFGTSYAAQCKAVLRQFV
jgi:fructosamine-3-kinase